MSVSYRSIVDGDGNFKEALHHLSRYALIEALQMCHWMIRYLSNGNEEKIAVSELAYLNFKNGWKNTQKEEGVFKFIDEAFVLEHKHRITTKAMEIPGRGCLVLVSTSNPYSDVLPTDTLQFVPGVKIVEKVDKITGNTNRQLVSF